MRRLLAEPHHDGSELYVVERPDELGGTAVVRLRVAARRGRPGAAALRAPTASRAPSRRSSTRTPTARPGGARSSRSANPVVRYRWLLAGGRAGYRWLNGLGAAPRTRSPDADDFVLTLDSRRADWHAARSSTRSSPTGSRPSGPPPRRTGPTGPSRATGTRLPEGRSRNTPRELFGGDLPGIEQHLDHIESLGANLIYLTPFFPARSHAPLRRDELRPRRPAARRRRRARAHCSPRRTDAASRIVGDLTLEPLRRQARLVPGGAARTTRRSAASSTSTIRSPPATSPGSAYRSLPKLDWRSAELRAGCAASCALARRTGSTAGAIDVANMVGRHGARRPQPRGRRAGARAHRRPRC